MYGLKLDYSAAEGGSAGEIRPQRTKHTQSEKRYKNYFHCFARLISRLTECLTGYSELKT